MFKLKWKRICRRWSAIKAENTECDKEIRGETLWKFSKKSEVDCQANKAGVLYGFFLFFFLFLFLVSANIQNDQTHLTNLSWLRLKRWAARRV